MVTYKNILYCTDFSESAKAALPFAIDITRKHGGMLHVVHVYRDPEHVAEYEISSQMKMDWVRLAQSLGTETEKKLNALCTEISKEVKPCRHEMLRGKPDLEIIRYAKENAIDLIVLASHGLSGWEHALFGSTAERVLRQSPCNVLIIRSHHKR